MYLFSYAAAIDTEDHSQTIGGHAAVRGWRHEEFSVQGFAGGPSGMKEGRPDDRAGGA
jgi:hypothetical protein